METSIGDSNDGAAPDADEQQVVAIPWHERTLPLFALFFLIGSFALLFTLLTVNNRQSAELGAHPYARRSNQIIEHWIRSGYFQSGGLMYLKFGTLQEPFYYRSSTGARALSGFVVEKLHWLIRGRYNWRLLAVHNQLLTLILSALVGLLTYRLVKRFGLEPLHAITLSVAAEIVTFTFPDNLGLYWEYSGQALALTFAMLFLVLEERAADQPQDRAYSWSQILAAFALAYSELVAALSFFVAYSLVWIILDRADLQWRRLLMTTALPFAFAVSIFALQWTWVNIRYPETPKHGSGLLFRSGLDGSSQYYGDHLDLVYGRDHARQTFRENREHLLRWRGLFFGGLASLIVVAAAYIRSRSPRIVLLVLVALVGTYLLYAALFSQSVFIHPYLYNILLATPLIIAVFAVVPALLEALTRYTGTVVMLVFFAALGYSMVQLRTYALRYPLSPAVTQVSASSGGARASQPMSLPANGLNVGDGQLQVKGGNVHASGALYERGRATALGEWTGVPYDSSIFTADRGAKWEVEQTDVTTLAYSVVGNTMTVAFRINSSSISDGSPTALQIAIPGGRQASRSITNNVIIDNGAQQSGYAQVAAGTKIIQIFRLPSVWWTPNQDSTRVIGQIMFEVR